MAYRVERQGVITAEGTIKVVPFDYRVRRPRRVPGTFRDAVVAFEGLAVET
ncbi:MAG: hypothetical protein IH608_06700 [Proteobacteria bacterium]|nr:hypothetical protein [Pseudomonadota bacterium]